MLVVDGHAAGQRPEELNVLANYGYGHRVQSGQGPGLYWYVLANGLGYDYRTGAYTFH
jgi:hypothetical protein